MGRVQGAVWGLLALAAAAFAGAAVIHFGVAIPLGFTTVRDPFAGAAVPEAVIAAVVAAGAAAARTRRPWARGAALGSTLFAVAGTCVGLRFTLPGPRTGDKVYHLGILALLLVILGLELLAGRRRPAAG
jgi:hypothetical protein